MKDEILQDAKSRMDKAVNALNAEFHKLRTGRATVNIFDGIKVDYYGSPTPINQMANIGVPESRLIVIQPFDATQLQAIEKAIISSELGLSPSNDGQVIRISIPQLTEERRKELVKVAKKYAEECRIAVRNARRDANDDLKELEKEKMLSQDELKKAQHETQELTDREVKRVDEILVEKEKEIMEI